MLAHDLNNGLAVALCNLDYLDTASVTGARRRSRAGVRGDPQTRWRRMSGLVANFVDIARFEDAAVKPRSAICLVRPLIDEVVEVHAVGGKARVVVDCPPELAGYFDSALIERVLHNLIGNAVRYCQNHGQIRITATQPDAADPTSVEISVFNNGPGIDPEVEASLFAKYARGANGKRGFGLYFCRLACEAHNGRIVYRGKPDGATFCIRLPGRP